MRIAIIDDNVSFANVLKEILVLNGYQTRVFYDGLKLTEEKHLKSFDVILIDMFLPDIYGISLIKEIRSRHIDTIFIVITVDMDEKNEIELKNLGIKYILKKPFKFEDLKSILKSIDRVESMITEFIYNCSMEKRLLFITDAQNFRIYEKVKKYNLTRLNSQIEKINNDETYLISGYKSNDLMDFLKKLEIVSEKEVIPKFIMIMNEDLKHFSNLLKNEPKTKEFILKNGFVIDLVFAMS